MAFFNKLLSPIPKEDIKKEHPFRDFFRNPIKSTKDWLNSSVTFSTDAAVAKPTPTPTIAPALTPTPPPNLPFAKPTPTLLPSKFTAQDLSEAIKNGYREWAGLKEQDLPDERIPMIKYADKMAEETMKYPLLMRFPFLLPILSILESSGGQNVSDPNNPFNWGLGKFSPGSVEETIEKVASGIAERMPAYERFRESKDFADLAERYAPPEENMTDKYIRDYKYLLDKFERQLRQ